MSEMVVWSTPERSKKTRALTRTYSSKKLGNAVFVERVIPNGPAFPKTANAENQLDRMSQAG